MGFFNFVSIFVLVSFSFNNNHFVAARPHQNNGSALVQIHHNAGGDNPEITTTPLSTFLPQATAIDPPQPAVSSKSHTHSKAKHTATKTSTSPKASSSSSSKYPPLDYSLVKSYSTGSFFDQFDFYTGSDPTHGFVE